MKFNTVAASAMKTAIADVQRALPGSTLVEAAPDYVGLLEVAEMVGQSRQNIRKLMVRHHDRLPAPVHTGNPSLWHLAQVLDFLADRNVGGAPKVADVAQPAMRINASRLVSTSG